MPLTIALLRSRRLSSSSFLFNSPYSRSSLSTALSCASLSCASVTPSPGSSPPPSNVFSSTGSPKERFSLKGTPGDAIAATSPFSFFFFSSSVMSIAICPFFFPHDPMTALFYLYSSHAAPAFPSSVPAVAVAPAIVFARSLSMFPSSFA